MKFFKCLIKVFLIVVLIGLACYIAINSYVKSYASKYILSQHELKEINDIECITVLGAHVRQDGSPSLMLESRLKCAIELYNNGICEKMLLSGDHGRSEYDEVNNMMQYVLENSDISKDNIFLDHAGFSTYETAYRANAIFGVKKAVFVTQKYHLYRAVYDARKNGIQAYGVFCDDIDYPGITYYKFRESLAICKDFVYCLLGVKPTYLGDSIPVSGNANATHDIIDN